LNCFAFALSAGATRTPLTPPANQFIRDCFLDGRKPPKEQLLQGAQVAGLDQADPYPFELPDRNNVRRSRWSQRMAAFEIQFHLLFVPPREPGRRPDSIAISSVENRITPEIKLASGAHLINESMR